ALAGPSTFRGTTFINEGTVVLMNSQALGATGSSEVQTINLTGSTSGTFTLSYKGQTTNPLPYNATPAQLQDQLNNLSTIGAVGNSVIVTRGIAEVQRLNVFGTTGGFTVRFNGSSPSPTLPINATPLEVRTALNNLSTISSVGGNVSVTGAGTAEVQQV